MNSAVRKYLSGGLLALISGMMLSCLPEDDFKDIEVMAPSPKVSLPLLNTNLSLSDLITVDQNKGILVENEDKSYSLLYKTRVASMPVDEFFPPIPAQNYSESYSLALDAPSFYLSPAPVTFSGQIPLDLNQLTLYKIESDQGNINLTLTSSYQHDIMAKVTFPDILSADGQPLQLNFDLPYWGSHSSTQNIPLKDYSININDSKINYEVEVSISGSGNAISSSDEISFQFNMADVDFSYAEGNFNNIPIPVEADTIDIPLLANAVNGNIALNPKFNMNLSNSFGVKILPDFSNIFVKRKSGTVVRLQDEGSSKFFSGNFEIPYPKTRDEGIATKQQVIDETNSNIEEAFAEIPTGIAYSLGFTLNSDAGDTSFVSGQSTVGIDMQVELPLEGSFNIILEDSIAVDFKSIADDLEELKVLIKTENSFPIDAKLQVYFLDEHGEKIKDENGQPIPLFNEDAKLLNAATITNTSTGETKPLNVDMPLAATINNAKYHLLEKTKSFLVRADMSSVSEQNNRIKIYSFYNIRFSMAMQAKTSLGIN